MGMTKIGAVMKGVTKPEKPSAKPKTLKQLANCPQVRLAKKVEKRVQT